MDTKVCLRVCLWERTQGLQSGDAYPLQVSVGVDGGEKPELMGQQHPGELRAAGGTPKNPSGA